MVEGKVRRWLAVAALCAALVGMSGCTRNAEAFQSFQLLNSERGARGIAPLALDDRLIAKAHEWAATMAASGDVRHSSLTSGVGSGWTVLGENVGSAGSVAKVHSLFMNSSVHRSMLLDRRMTKVGTGVAVVGGRAYVVQVFGA